VQLVGFGDTLIGGQRETNAKHNKALHPTAKRSVRFGRKLPSLSTRLAAGELSVLLRRAALQELIQ
jgi:hypothetical protein